jgi:hypothetical protein
VNLSSPTNATILDGQGVGTITNDDAAPATPTLFISDASIAEGNSGPSIATFTVTLSPASAQTVTVNFATANGTATLAGNDYQSASGMLTFNPSDTSKPINVTINGDTLVEPDETLTVNLDTATGGASIGTPSGTGTIQNDDTADLKISQVYPGGGLTGASFTNDFIELFNHGTTTVDFSVTPYSMQFLSTGGSTWAKTDLTTGTLLPGRYFLIKEGSSGVGAALPTPDVTGSTSLNITSTTPGKVALVKGGTLLTGNCPNDDGNPPFNPVDGTIADFVGYGLIAATPNHCYEGSGPASFTSGSNTTADFRKTGGCTDTNDNAGDFLVSGPFPRNSSSPANNCAGGATPNLTINDVTVAEGNSGPTTATFTVSLSAPAQGTDVSFDIATQDSTATTANSDYVAKTLTNQIILAGQTTYTFTVVVNGDLAIEPDEAFLVNVINASGATITDGQGVGTIQNDDFPTLSIDDVSASEGDSGPKTFTFHVTLSAPAPATVTFDIATADGTATVANNDYVARSITGQTITAGGSSFNFDVTVNGDTNIEPNEAFFVNVTNVTGATVLDGQGQGTIQTDDVPVLSITQAVSVAEGNSSTTNATFTVTLTPAINQTVTVNYATANGTATAGSDYQTTSGTLTFDPNQTTKTIDVPVNGDTLVEPDETFTLGLSGASANATVSVTQGTGTGTITNDDTANLVISQVYPGGGLTNATFTNDFIELFNRGTTTVDFSVTPYSVQFLSTGGTIWAKTDLTTGTLTPGRYFLVKEFSSGAVGAVLPTADATGTLNITSTTDGKVALVAGATLLTGNCPNDDGNPPFNPVNSTIADFVGYGGNSATPNHCYEGSGPASFTSGSNTTADFRKTGGCTDTNDNAADFLISGPFPRNSASPANNCAGGATPNLTINDVTVAEGNSGTSTATFTVSLSAPAQATDVTFDIATQNNSATAPSDYVAKSLTNQVIPAGQTTYSFAVTINGDTTVEPDETFFVNVTNATGAAITDGQGIGTIQNDEVTTLSVSDVSANEGNAGPTTFTFVVSLSAPAPAGGVTFDIATADGTATVANSDYVARSLTAQTIPAGLQTFNFDVTVNGDATVEPTETFLVNVTSVTGATILDGQGQGTITNDDGAAPITKVVISQVYGGGGNAGATLKNDFIEIFNAGNQTVNLSTWSVQYMTAAGSGTWTATNLTGSIAPGHYYLVQELAGAGGTTNLPTPDATGTTNLAGTAGKVALVSSTTVLVGACPTTNVVDEVGYGAAATCFEGTGPAPAPSSNNLQSALRSGAGCTDTDQNASDFTAATANPRNTATATNQCPGTIAPPDGESQLAWIGISGSAVGAWDGNAGARLRLSNHAARGTGSTRIQTPRHAP